MITRRSKLVSLLAPLALSVTVAVGAYTFYAIRSGSELPHLAPSAAKDMPPAPKNFSISAKVQPGDTFLTILENLNVPTNDAFAALSALKTVYNPSLLRAGQAIHISYTQTPVALNQAASPALLQQVEIPAAADKKIVVQRTPEDTFAAQEIIIPLEKRVRRAQAVVDSSLYGAGLESGIPMSVMAELIKAYSYDVDFQRDIRDGNTIEVLFESYYTPDGKLAKHGDLLFASLNLRNKNMEVYRYVPKGGEAEYFTADGKSVRKSLLKTPINGARISSAFGLRRHPVLGYSRMHKGIDFAAPQGTPIYAAGNGKIAAMGWQNGYGNYLKICHNNTYCSAYGHISRFARGVRKGMSVKQGQVVAYVGKTGMATGPHLHYEILANNRQVNPSGVKFQSGTQLAGNELARFQESKEDTQIILASTPVISDTTVALGQ